MHNAMVKRAQTKLKEYNDDQKQCKAQAKAEAKKELLLKKAEKGSNTANNKHKTSSNRNRSNTNTGRPRTHAGRNRSPTNNSDVYTIQNPLKMQLSLKLQRFMRRSSQWPAIYFNHTVLLAIVGSTVVMALPYHGMSLQYAQYLAIADLVFAGFFIVEAVIKLLGLGPRKYFQVGWNQFDFSIVIGNTVGIILGSTVDIPLVNWISGTCRLFRVGRVIRLLKVHKGLKMLFTALVLTIPAMTNVALLLFLMYCIYACWGMQMFARVKQGEILDEHVNFQSFGHSLLTLVRASTGESWNILMYDAAVRTDCDPLPKYDPDYCGPGRAGRDFLADGKPCKVYNGCGDNFSFFFFLSFSVIVGYVFLNLFIAVIMEGFESVNEATNENAEVEASNMSMPPPKLEKVGSSSSGLGNSSSSGNGNGSGELGERGGNILQIGRRDSKSDEGESLVEMDSFLCGLTNIEYKHFSTTWARYDTKLAMALPQVR